MSQRCTDLVCADLGRSSAIPIARMRHLYRLDEVERRLTRLARAVQTEVAKTENVGLTYLVGDAMDAIRIAPDPERLALYGVTLQQLAGKVSQANRTLNTGKLRDQGEQIDLVAGETLTAPAEVANLLLTTRDGRPVYVADVAEVSYVPDTSDHMVAHVTRAEDGGLNRSRSCASAGWAHRCSSPRSRVPSACCCCRRRDSWLRRCAPIRSSAAARPPKSSSAS